ncbi:glutamine--tRNA ligase/YqeY domain fusion protein [Spirochaetota bacterium]
MTEETTPKTKDFIREMVEEDIKNNTFGGKAITRFPPEPNGFLHIGHAKAICIDFGIAEDYKGTCHLRFDDTNPSKEEQEYINSITEDVKWLGFDWGEHLYYASSYFEKMYEYALTLIKDGKAYVDDQDADAIRNTRGTLTEPGKESPYRGRSAEENLSLFEKMKSGEFADGEKVLRAKIDMASPNLNMRDPVMYRIMKMSHPKTGDAWCIYPMYDWAHGLEDSIEGITHSLCTLEFEDHRPLYDWFLKELGIHHPKQIEFARLNLTYTVMSKRKLRKLVEEKQVSGWDDPRMPTISGLRRRGYTPEAIRDFCSRIGVAKANSVVDISLLEHCVREDLNKRALRKMAVLHPLKLIIDNYPEGKTEELEAENNPENESAGKRTIPFSRELYIERNDFSEDPPPKYFRLAPGREIRLKHAYYVTCVSVVKDEKTGEIKEVHCTYDPKTKGGWSDDGRKVKGTSHWVSVHHAAKAEVRIYEQLFTKENPEEEDDFTTNINNDSIQTIKGCFVEQSLKNIKAGERLQFLRQGYFCVDSGSTPEMPVFNRIVPLKDTWAKISKTK